MGTHEGAYDEVLHIDRLLLTDTVYTVDGLVLGGRVPPAIHHEDMVRARQLHFDEYMYLRYRAGT